MTCKIILIFSVMFGLNNASSGWRAARVIQRGTQASPFKPKMRVKQYERPGNFRDAFQTFKSAKPTDVKRFHGPNGVSDRL